MIDESLFDVPLRRDQRIPEVTDDSERAWMMEGERLLFAIGVINHDDSIEVVLLRVCDPYFAHGDLWPVKPTHCKWRVGPTFSLTCMDGTRLDPEQCDRIYRAVEKAIRKARKPQTVEVPQPTEARDE